MLGFNTGTLRNAHDPEQILELYREIGCTAVELSHSHIAAIDARPEGFGYVSLHDAPPQPYGDDEASRALLVQLQERVLRLALDRVVLHPNSVMDWSIIKQYDIPWGIENLDARNERFGTPEELVPILEEYDLPLVLDINHCATRTTHRSHLLVGFKSFSERVSLNST